MFLVAAALVVSTGAVLADPPGHAKAWGHKDKQGRAYNKVIVKRGGMRKASVATRVYGAAMMAVIIANVTMARQV